MKKTTTKTVTETEVLCDYCGALVLHCPSECVVCGKVACAECFMKHMRELRLDKFPRFYPNLVGMNIFSACACNGCANDITRKFDKVVRWVGQANKQCEQWTREYRTDIDALNTANRAIEIARESHK